MSEKRKNDERRGFQWWLLVIGFALGVVVMIGVQTTGGGTAQASVELPYSQAQLEMTVTALMAQAQSTPAPGLDPMILTATQIVREATGTALAPMLTASP